MWDCNSVVSSADTVKPVLKIQSTSNISGWSLSSMGLLSFENAWENEIHVRHNIWLCFVHIIMYNNDV